ncbi:MAG: phosphoribosylformylglycinamidine cyclo-ligase [Bacteroidetes bacterium CG12_big_fil_rev_8_21_14_0_65_60_17]|nr:MAG: phosphoribosylformylglycinamidine cyclo-ligase [Bacteroidetes bacterium CG12_big_fil_rev_8_21_14_0_65_60_17]
MATYKEAGVDIAAGEETVRRIKPLVRETFTPGVLTDIGAFGAFFEFDWASMEEPVMVSSVDGVGTKLKVAFAMDRHDTVGQDLVNHCVNDIAVCGARPLYFMDYFSTGRLSPDVAVSVVKGFSTACVENRCALIGGETAEMPDMYAAGEYDLAGMITGVVEKRRIVDGSGIQAGHVAIGLPSTGLHTNGYSLARKVLFQHFDVHDRPEELHGASVGETLLVVHRSYLHAIQAAMSAADIAGMAHITGGGIPGNTVRILPEGRIFDVDYGAWDRPPVFQLIQDLGQVPEDDMRSTLNLGMGLVLFVAPDDVLPVERALSSLGEEPIRIGSVR